MVACLVRQDPGRRQKKYFCKQKTFRSCCFVPPTSLSRITGVTITTTEQVFVPGHLSRLPLGPGQKVAFVPGPTASRANVEDRGFLSRVELPIRTKDPFYPGWCYQPGQKAHPRDSSKVSYSILSHVYYLGELARPRRQLFPAVRSGTRAARISCFPVILHKSPRTFSKYNPLSTPLSQICFRISP